MLARQVGFAGVPVERGVVVETADQAVQVALSGVASPRSIRVCAPRKWRAVSWWRPSTSASWTGRTYTLVCRADETDLARIAAFRDWALTAIVEASIPEVLEPKAS